MGDRGRRMNLGTLTETECREKLKRSAALIVRRERRLAGYTILVWIKEKGLTDYRISEKD